jgi:FKBP-type peptidyl-prolyl cis-trans isomerase
VTGALVLFLVALADGGASSAAPTTAPPADVAAAPPSAIKLPSGLAMRVLKKGTGARHPRDNDCVLIQYTAWRRDGSFLTGTRHWNEPENQCLAKAFPGVTAALKTMVAGEQRRLWVPAALTFVRGEDDDDEGRPRPIDTTIDLELLSISAAPPTPRHLTRPPPTARKTPSGLAIEVLKRGKGTDHPQDSSAVMLHFSGWTSDGRLIESSVMAHHPAVFQMAGVMAGWREALWQMVVGDRVRLWIPRDLAFGAQPRRGQPKGDLVYELELLEIQ